MADAAKLYPGSKEGVVNGMPSVSKSLDRAMPHLPLEFFEPRWYAAYTRANHEKRVASEIEARAVEHFLPVYSSVRRWKDRRVMLELPLFPGYVFVRLALRDRLRVLQIPSVVRLVSFNGTPAALPDTEMEAMRSGLGKCLRAEPHPFLTVGRRVRITAGPFTGLEGVLVRKKNNLRVVVSIDLIQRAMAIELEAAELNALLEKA